MTIKPVTPGDHPDLEHFDYECDELGVTLSCFFDYEPSEVGAVERGTGLKLEPDYPEQWTLVHVYLPCGREISAVMRQDILDDIQQQGEDMFSLKQADEAGEAAIDRWMESRND